MALIIPTLKTIIDRMDADAEGRLPGAQPRLRRSLLGAIIRAVAGSVFGLYQLIAKTPETVMPDTATGDILDRWADIYLTVQRKPATAAAGTIGFTGTDGTNIPASTTVQRVDGVEYTTDALVTIAAGVASAAITASAAGADANTAAAVTLTLTAPIAGVNSNAVVDGSGITGGADTESDDLLRTRVLDRIQNPPQGGAAHDYIAWAKDNAGVTRAWSYPLEGGTGNVVVRFMMDDSYADGIPLAGDETTVQNYIELLQPAAAILTVVAPVATALNCTINVTVDTPAVRAAVEAELRDMILRDSEPGGTILLSHINEAISRATDETDHVVTAPAADVVYLTNEIAVFGVITWV
jgi:uncharacterized phage protein gp47/JayE